MKGKRAYSFVTALGIFCLLIIVPSVGYGADLTIGTGVTTTGDWKLTDAMSATSFSGDGSALTKLNPSNLASGTADISISGNAATATTATTASSVTNGVYSNGSYSDPSWITSLSGSKVTGLDCAGGRYEDNGDGTVTDCRTGLIWLKNAKCTDTSGTIANTNGYLTWANANTWAAGLGNGLCGLADGSHSGDWRLPTKTEWMAMVQSAKKHVYTAPSLTNAAGTGHWAEGDIFDNVQSNYHYWSGSSVGINFYWNVNMYDGYMDYTSLSNNYYVWPVRSGQ